MGFSKAYPEANRYIDELGQSLHYGVEVTALRSTDDGITVEARQGGREVRFQADRAICTVPAPVL